MTSNDGTKTTQTKKKSSSSEKSQSDGTIKIRLKQKFRTLLLGNRLKKNLRKK